MKQHGIIYNALHEHILINFILYEIEDMSYIFWKLISKSFGFIVNF